MAFVLGVFLAVILSGSFFRKNGKQSSIEGTFTTTAKTLEQNVSDSSSAKQVPNDAQTSTQFNWINVLKSYVNKTVKLAVTIELLNLEYAKDFPRVQLKVKELHEKIKNISLEYEDTLNRFRATISEDFRSLVDGMMHKHVEAQRSRDILFFKNLAEINRSLNAFKTQFELSQRNQINENEENLLGLKTTLNYLQQRQRQTIKRLRNIKYKTPNRVRL
jgi:hypothetical protein